MKIKNFILIIIISMALTVDQKSNGMNSNSTTFSSSAISQNISNDSDGDGITDDLDDFPNDPNKAFLNYYPAAGFGSLAYEDLWPATGDFDFNDMVLDYRFATVTNAQDYVVDITATFICKASGAFYSNGFGFNLPASDVGLKTGMLVTGSELHESYINIDGNGLEEGQDHPTIIVFDNIYRLLQHPGSGTGVNTESESPFVDFETVTIVMTPTQNTFEANDFNVLEWNPFIIVNMNRDVEVHLHDKAPTTLADQSLFGTINDDSDLNSGRYYVTTNNLPFAIDIPSTFDWPKEKIDISLAFLHFIEWAKSSGVDYDEWYLNKQGYRNNDNFYVYPDSPTIPESEPVAAFIANKTKVIETESILFTDHSKNTPTSWYWDFGDGESSTEQNPTHTYSKKGVYTVSLTATNSFGSDTEEKLEYITVIRQIEEGISENFLDLDYTKGSIETYDPVAGTVKINFAESVPEIAVGTVFVVDMDTMGYLRKVVSSHISGNTITVETERSSLIDVFIDKDFILDTEFIPPNTTLKSTSSNREISEALTDSRGHIHPVEIIYHKSNSQIIKKSALNYETTKMASVNILDFTHDFSDKTLYANSDTSAHLYIDEGQASLISDAILDFKFKGLRLKMFKFYLESEAAFKAKLALDLEKEFNKEKTKKLVNMNAIKAKFMVGPVPVWVSFDCDIYSKYNIDAKASLHADWGFESNHTLKLGAKYESGSLSPISEYTPENIIYPLNVEGEANLEARFEIYPQVDILLYSILGPSAEIVPYLEGNYNAAFQSEITSTGTEEFLAWNSGLDLGLESRIGLEFEPFCWPLRSWNINTHKTYDIFEYPIWSSPDDIELLSDIDEIVDTGTEIPLTFKVTDLLDNAVPLCPVYINGDGDFSSNILSTDIDGEVNVDWEIESSGKSSATAIIYNADKSIIKSIELNVNENVNANLYVTTSAVTNVTATSVTSGGSISYGGEWPPDITSKGLCWSTSENPSISDSITNDGTGTGDFVSNLTDLTPNTTYYLRAYAISDDGISYGKQKQFTTIN